MEHSDAVARETRQQTRRNSDEGTLDTERAGESTKSMAFQSCGSDWDACQLVVDVAPVVRWRSVSTS